MKLLVSDFDGTFYSAECYKMAYINARYVETFRENGNLFSIATARSYASIKTYLNKFNLKYDYLICNNGSCLFDNFNNPLYCNIINPVDLSNIVNSLINNPCVSNVILIDIFGKQTSSFDNVIEVLCVLNLKNIFYTFEIRKKFRNIGFKTASYANYTFIKNKSDKVDGIEQIRELINIPKENIYTIGNEINDKQMLIDYNGYRMLFSNPLLISDEISITTSVKNTIKKLERK